MGLAFFLRRATDWVGRSWVFLNGFIKRGVFLC